MLPGPPRSCHGNRRTSLSERLAATREQLTTPPPAPAPGDRERDWRADAACQDADPELFFPEQGQLPQVAAAMELCAGCAVRGPCLDSALHGPVARDDHHGIFAGTTARDRRQLRGRPSMADGTRFAQDRAAAEQALALANQISIDRAARELGVSKQALRRAFDQHGLDQPQVFQGGPQRSPFLHDRDAAAQAWQRAAEVGINQTRKELHTSDKALRTAWTRHGLGLPPRPTVQQPTGRLDPVFVALNPQVLPVRAGSDAERFARVRRAELLATLGAEAVVEMHTESRSPRQGARVWAITRRAERAQTLARQREDRSERRSADRAERGQRPHHPRARQEREMLPDDR